MYPLYPVVLDRHHLHRAWPLVQLAAPASTLKEWLDYGRRQVKGGRMPRRGLFALACDRGYFYGLAAFERSGRPPAEVVLEINLLGQAGLAHARAPLATMTDAMVRLACLMQCSLIRLKARDLPNFVPVAALADCGFAGNGDYLERRTNARDTTSGDDR